MDEKSFALLLKFLLEKELKREVELDGRWLTIRFGDKGYCFKVIDLGEKPYIDNDN